MFNWNFRYTWAAVRNSLLWPALPNLRAIYGHIEELPISVIPAETDPFVKDYTCTYWLPLVIIIILTKNDHKSMRNFMLVLTPVKTLQM